MPWGCFEFLPLRLHSYSVQQGIFNWQEVQVLIYPESAYISHVHCCHPNPDPVITSPALELSYRFEPCASAEYLPSSNLSDLYKPKLDQGVTHFTQTRQTSLCWRKHALTAVTSTPQSRDGSIQEWSGWSSASEGRRIHCRFHGQWQWWLYLYGYGLMAWTALVLAVFSFIFLSNF